MGITHVKFRLIAIPEVGRGEEGVWGKEYPGILVSFTMFYLNRK